MPITVYGVKKQLPVRPPRGRGFDTAITELAPHIRGLQTAGYRGIAEIADQLNQLGLSTPSGGAFSYTTTRRLLRRLAQLGLCAGPMTLAQAKGHLKCKKEARVAAIMQKFQKNTSID